MGFILDLIETGMQIGIAVEMGNLERERQRLEAEKARIEEELRKIEREREGGRSGKRSASFR